jgi:hypothetical protein
MAYQPELEKLERRYQEDPGRNFAQLAETYRKLGRLDDALDVLRAHLTDRPNYVSGLVVLGRCLLDQHNDAEARETFERVLSVDGEHIIALKALGEIAERGQELDAARRWYQRLVDVDPMNDDAVAALGRLPSEGTIAGAASAPAAPESPPAALEAALGESPQAVSPEAAAPPAAPAAEPPRDIAPAAWAQPVLEPSPLHEVGFSAGPEQPPPVWGTPVDGEVRPEPQAAAPDVPPPMAEPPMLEAASLADERRHEDLAPAEEPVARTEDFAADVTIERASSEYSAEPAKLEPVSVERIDEVDMPLAAEAEVDVAARSDGEEGVVDAAAPAPETAAAGPAESTPAEPALAEPEARVEPGEAPAEPEPAPSEAPPLSGDATWIEQEEEIEPINLEGRSEADELVIEPFDESLGWDAGERVSQQISSEDLEEAEHLHENSLEAAVEEILEHGAGTLPDAEEVEALSTPQVEGLEVVPSEAPEVEPVEGFETSAVEATSETPPATPEPVERDLVSETPLLVDAAEAEAQEAAQQLADRRASLAGLPVFVPEDEALEPLVVEAEPEPVVTETMAELYARQGLVAEARDVYRKLLEERPADPRLTARLAELEAPARPLAQPTIRYLAMESGGQRARDFLSDVLGAREAPASVAVSEPTEARAPSPEPEPMDEAFAEEPGEIKGQPTQPAADEVSLAAIFGDAAPAPPPQAKPESPDDGGRPPGGFSFDDMFGKGDAQRPADSARPARETLADDEGDDAFRDWLKSLKS